MFKWAREQTLLKASTFVDMVTDVGKQLTAMEVFNAKYYSIHRDQYLTSWQIMLTLFKHGMYFNCNEESSMPVQLILFTL